MKKIKVYSATNLLCFSERKIQPDSSQVQLLRGRHLKGLSGENVFFQIPPRNQRYIFIIEKSVCTSTIAMLSRRRFDLKTFCYPGNGSLYEICD